ncbi:MAG: hypothetical protein ACYC9S_08490 [Leptospirales bacterium]
MSMRPIPEIQSTAPVYSNGSVSETSRAGGQMLLETPVDMSERVLASLERVGNEPGVVTVYSVPVGHSVMTDVSVQLTDGTDGTKEVHNHYGIQTSIPSGSGNGVAMLGSYEESAKVADIAALYFQGMKINRRV